MVPFRKLYIRRHPGDPMGPSPFPYELRALEKPERAALLNDRALLMFIGSVGKFPANKPLMDRLEQFRNGLLREDPAQAIDLNKLTFPSAYTTRWTENNTVHAYDYCPGGSPRRTRLRR